MDPINIEVSDVLEEVQRIDQRVYELAIERVKVRVLEQRLALYRDAEGEALSAEEAI